MAGKPKRKKRTTGEIRGDILKYLESQTFPRTTGQIAREVRLNWYSTNYHLALMKAEGLLFHEKVGRQNQWWPENIDGLTKKVRLLEKQLKERDERIRELEGK